MMKIKSFRLFKKANTNKQAVKSISHIGILVLLLSGNNVFATNVDNVVGVAKQRVELGQSTQSQVDQLANQQRNLLAEYENLVKSVDGLKLYNQLLNKQITKQQTDMTNINNSINNVAVIERQIMPLADRMVDGLEQFIKLDTPFLLKERQQRVNNLKDLMTRPDVSVAEKVRKVFEAYQIENDYGRTIGTYRGQLNINGKQHEVKFLRIGRISLLYTTLDGQVGRWNKGKWQSLDADKYRTYIDKGIRIAAKQQAPNLITIPVNVPAETLK